MDQLRAPAAGGPRRGRAGFTLIEVMIALSLLAFGLLAMLALQIHAMRGGKVGRHTTQAAQVAQDRLEMFNRIGWTDPLLTPGGWVIAGDTITNQVWVDGATQIAEQTFSVDWRVQNLAFDPTDPTDPTLKQIDVRVTWREPSDPAGMPARRYAATVRRFN